MFYVKMYVSQGVQPNSVFECLCAFMSKCTTCRGVGGGGGCLLEVGIWEINEISMKVKSDLFIPGWLCR